MAAKLADSPMITEIKQDSKVSRLPKDHWNKTRQES
jgi:hypothetical protein